MQSQGTQIVAAPSEKQVLREAQDDNSSGLGEEDGLAFEGDGELGLDGGDDFGFEGLDVGEGGVLAVDQGQGVAGGDAGWSGAVALNEAGVFEEPGGGELG